MGFSFDARQAGQKPKKSPTTEEIMNAYTADVSSTRTGQPAAAIRLIR